MNILLIHQHFRTPASGGAIRSYYLAKALVDQGHRVVVITAHNESGKVFLVDGIEVHYLPVGYDNAFGFYRRSFSFLWFNTLATLRAVRFRHFDRCYAISTPLTVGLTARFLKFCFGIPYFFEVGDLWPDAPVEMGFVSGKFLPRLLFAMEKRIYQSADALVALSPAIGSALERKVSGKPIHLVPNMADCEFYHPATKRTKTEAQFGVSGKFVVSYIGALGIANGLELLLNCARCMKQEHQSVHFLIAGDGARKEFLRDAIRSESLTNVTLLDFVDRAGVQEIMEVTDAAFISYQSFPILETGSPNKYFDALAAGKLIIVNFSGWIREEIESSGCGFYTDPRKPETLSRQLGPYLDNPASLLQAQTKSRLLAETRYSRVLLSKTFSALFDPLKRKIEN